MLALAPVSPPGEAVDEAKAFLRIEHDDEDALIAGLIATAIGACEAFLARVLLQRSFSDRVRASGDWQRLAATPVLSISGVAPLAVDAYAIDIDANGDGWVRATAPGSATTLEVTGTAGLASGWGAIPDAVRQGLLRLVAHLHAVRDATDDAGPPAAVAALWRPWRRMRMG